MHDTTSWPAPGSVIGYLNSGRPVRLQAGGSETATETPPAPAPAAPAPPAPAAPAGTQPEPQQPAAPRVPAGQPDGGQFTPGQQPPPQQQAPADTTDWRTVAEQARAEAAQAKADFEQAQEEARRWKGFARKHEDHLKGKNETIRTQESFFRLVADKLEIPYDDTPDPEQLTQALAEQTQLARDLTVERAIYLGAAREGADAAALLDSREFLTRAAQIDPESTAFPDLIRDMVREAAKEARYKLAVPAAGLTPQTTQQPAQLQPSGQFQQPPPQQATPVQQQPPAPASGADFSGAPPGDGLWDQATYDYWATGPGKAKDRDGKIMTDAIAKGLLANLGVGKSRRPSSRR